MNTIEPMRDIKKEFGQTYNQSVDKIYRFVLIKVNSKEIAEDLTAETFTKVWRAFELSEQNQEPILNLQSFCYRTARNLVTDYYRTKGRTNLVSLEMVELAIDSEIEKEAIISSDLEGVFKAMAGLKDEEQDLIIWRYLDELSIPEIAELIEKSETATRVAIHRALSSLKKVLIQND